MTGPFPSNFELTLVGNDLEQLKLALRLLEAGGRLHTDGHSTVGPQRGPQGEGVDYEIGDLERHPEVPALVFYAHGVPDSKHAKYTPKKMSKPDSIAFFMYSWLESLDDSAFGERFSDGSTGRGWRLNAGYSVGAAGEYTKRFELATLGDLHPEIDFRHFQYMIRPEWTFYSK